MITPEGYRDRKVAVLGLGRTGFSAVRALIAGGAEVLAWDDDPNRRAAATQHGAFAVAPDAAGWRGISALVLSPGVPLTHPAPHMAVKLADRLGAEVLGDVELFARTRPRAPVAAITGTNGKSTTTALVGHILAACGRRVELGANLGRPVLDFEDLPVNGNYVLELSSYQIDLTRSLRPQVAALTNISPDHLDRHGGMEGYVAAKRRLLEMAPASATLVIGIDDPWSAALAEELRGQGRKVMPVAVGRRIDDGIYVQEGSLCRNAGCSRVCLAELRGVDSLRGAHNWQNAAIAYAVCEALGLHGREIASALRGFPGLPHRLQVVARAGNVTFVNDSKATNAEAAAHALGAYDHIHWIAGGIAKAGGIESLRPHFGRIERAYLIGEAAEGFAATLGEAVPHEIDGTLEVAVRQAHAAAAAGGGVVLLSPACASFDQFANFEARGEAFRQLAEAIAAGAGAPRRAGGAR